MKLIALPDLHGIYRLDGIMNQLAAVDLILLPGDLTNYDPAQARRLRRALAQFPAAVYAVPGNWDDREVSAYLTEAGINLDCRVVEQAGIKLAGMGGSLPYFMQCPNTFSEDEYSRLLDGVAAALSPGEAFVFVCHQPPFGTINDLVRGQHTGSRAVRAFIETHQPVVCLTGHIHEAVGIDTIGRTRIVNPGPLWQGCYAYCEVEGDEAVTVEIRCVDNLPSR